MPSDSGHQPNQPVQLVSSSELLVQAVQAFKSGNLQSLGLAGFGVFLPQILSTWLLAPASHQAAGNIWSAALDVKKGAAIDGSTFPGILGQAAEFYRLFGFINLLLWLVFTAAYLAMLYQSLHHMRPWAFPRLSLRELLGDMVRLTLKRGILLAALVVSLCFLLTAFLTSLGFGNQADGLISLFVIPLSLMAPVLMVAEHKSALRSLTHALTLRYARRVAFGGASAVLSLVTIFGLFFCIEYLFSWIGSEALDWFATGTPQFLAMALPGMPFSVGFALVDLVQSMLTTSMICLLPGATAALYIQVHFRNSRRDLSILA
ncbi:MAG: hypothetical protein RIQ81_2350 [Pseudomonadota bacterium]